MNSKVVPSTVESLKTRRLNLTLAAGLITVTCGGLYAQSASEDYGIVSQLLGQGNAAVNGSQALKNNSCVPTSVANGLSYLDAYQQGLGNPSPFAFNPNTYTAVNRLQSFMATDPVTATQPGPALAGLQTYLTTLGPLGNPAPSVSAWQDWVPSAQTLANVLNAHDGVQLGILWATAANPLVNNAAWTPKNGGHFVSLESESLTAGVGTMGIVDPWGNTLDNNAASSASYDTLNVSLITLAAGGINALPAGTYLKVVYTPSGLGDFPFNDTGTGLAGAGGTGLIALDQVEAVVVPETSPTVTSLAVTVGLGAFLLIRRRK